MIITELKRIGKSEKYKVFVDGNFHCFLQAEIIVKYHIGVGTNIEEINFDEIKKQSDDISCFQSALDYISKNLKTKKQLKENLKQKGYCLQSIEKAVEKLENYGYLNDKYFAEMFVKSLENKKGEIYIKNALKQKGVSEKIINEIFEDFETDDNAIYTLAQKYMKNKEKSFENKQKLYRHLLSKGFSFEQAKNASDKIFGGDDDWD
ncbi:MAG: regulatory protein RecX [Clostridia bacterium]|nr:regulatory protein RecX [Clostridia bacterium]